MKNNITIGLLLLIAVMTWMILRTNPNSTPYISCSTPSGSYVDHQYRNPIDGYVSLMLIEENRDDGNVGEYSFIECNILQK